MKKQWGRLVITTLGIIIGFSFFLATFPNNFSGKISALWGIMLFMAIIAVLLVWWQISPYFTSVTQNGIGYYTVQGKVFYSWDKIEKKVRYSNKNFIFITGDRKEIKLFADVYGEPRKIIEYLNNNGFTVQT